MPSARMILPSRAPTQLPSFSTLLCATTTTISTQPNESKKVSSVRLKSQLSQLKSQRTVSLTELPSASVRGISKNSWVVTGSYTPCPHDHCWNSRKNATQMPAMIVRLTPRAFLCRAASDGGGAIFVCRPGR